MADFRTSHQQQASVRQHDRGANRIDTNRSEAKPRLRKRSWFTWKWISSMFACVAVIMMLAQRYRDFQQRWQALHESRDRLAQQNAELTTQLAERTKNEQIRQAELERTRQQLRLVSEKHFTRLHQFAEFVAANDPTLARRVFQETLAFATQAEINSSDVTKRLADLEQPQSLPSSTQLEILELADLGSSTNIELSVRDGAGNFVTGLRRVDFDLQSAGRTIHPVRVVATTRASGSHHISVVLDCSSSVAAGFRELQAASKTLVRQLADPWKVRVVRFASEVQAVSPWSHDADLHCAAIDSLKADGATQLMAALQLEAQELARHASVRSMVLFTDGRDSAQAKSLDAVLRALREHRIHVHVVALDNVDLDEPTLRRLASESSGSFQKVADIHQLTAAFQELADKLRMPIYRISLLNQSDRKPLTISVGGQPPISLHQNSRQALPLTAN